MMRRHSRLLIQSGLLLLAAALGLLLWNHREEQQAAAAAQQALSQLSASTADTTSAPAEVREMPVITVEGIDYVGTLDIPSLGLSLPIISHWSDNLLKMAPCRYKGSAYQGDLILAGHNYRVHFARLPDLRIGDAVVFTDVEGTAFHYTVSGFEQLADTAVQEMEEGEWELTLFTCTIDGKERFTVRCKENPSPLP